MIEQKQSKFDHQKRLDVKAGGITIIGGYCNGMPAWILHGGAITNSKAVAKQWAMACAELMEQWM